MQTAKRQSLESHQSAFWLLVFCLLITPAVSQSESNHSVYFQGLRERGLYLIAEDYAVSRLNSQRLLPDDQARFTIELAQTLTEHGAYSARDQREELWNEAERLLLEFVEGSPQNPRIIEVQAELALLPARFGDALAWELFLYPGNLQAQSAATRQFQKAVQGFSQFQPTLASVQSKPSNSALADGALSSEELLLLKQKVSFFQARSNFFLALHDKSGPNKAGRLLDVASQLERLGKANNDSPWSVHAKILRAKLARTEADYRQASAILNSLQNASSDAQIINEILAERVRNELDQGHIDAGLKMIADYKKSGGMITDELRAVAVEALLAAWKVAREKGKSELQSELLGEAQGHHELTRGKWHQFTSSQLQRVQQKLELGDELAVLIRDAQSTYHAGELDQAAKLFRDAALVAHRQRKEELAVEYAFTSGSIEVSLQHWRDAVNVYQDITAQFPQNRRASDAAIMKCYALGQLYLNEPTAESRTEYESALQLAAKNFPGTNAAIEATWMLALHQEQRLQWTDAIELYRKVPSTHPRFDTASLRIVVLYEKILTRLREIAGPVDEWEDQLVQEIVRIEEQFPPGNVLRSYEQCQCSLIVSQLLLQHRERWYRVADQWLERIDRTVEYQRTEASIHQIPVDPKWLQIDRTAAQMRIVSLAGQEKLQAARSLLLELQKTDPGTMLGILLGLTEMTSSIDPRHQVELGHLQLEAINKLVQSRSQLSAQQQYSLDDAHAEAFIAIGNLPEAAKIYETLLKKAPRDELLIRKVISVYMKREKAEDLVKAREWWTKIESLHPPGAADWIESRLEIARLDHRLGKPGEARKLLGVTQALYPKLGSTELKRQYEELIAQLAEN